MSAFIDSTTGNGAEEIGEIGLQQGHKLQESKGDVATKAIWTLMCFSRIPTPLTRMVALESALDWKRRRALSFLCMATKV